MAEILQKLVMDCATGESRYIPLTPEEIAQREVDAIIMEQERTAREAEAQRIADLKASAKAKLIAGQALTAEEASVIVF